MKISRWKLINIFIVVVTTLAFGSLRFVPQIPDPNEGLVSQTNIPIVMAHR